MKETNSTKIQRFAPLERTIHWMVAFTFIYAALSGLGLWSPRLFWLTTVLGGGVTVRVWHPWAGVLFVGVLAVMFTKWVRDMKLDRDDRTWLRGVRRFATHQHQDLPEAGRFNGGQKTLFWVQSVSAVLLLGSGLVLWFPEQTPQGLRLVAIVVHAFVAIISLGGIIIHIYMGTAAVPGALRGMTQGWVKSAWAESHHPKWFRQTSRR